DRLHLVEGLLIAIVDIDEVIQIIRAAEDTGTARQRLMTVFDLSQPQAEHILELRLRQLTRFSTIELEDEKQRLEDEIQQLIAILESDQLLRKTVSDELAAVAEAYGQPRRTELVDAEAESVTAAPAAKNDDDAADSSLQIPD